MRSILLVCLILAAAAVEAKNPTNNQRCYKWRRSSEYGGDGSEAQFIVDPRGDCEKGPSLNFFQTCETNTACKPKEGSPCPASSFCFCATNGINHCACLKRFDPDYDVCLHDEEILQLPVDLPANGATIQDEMSTRSDLPKVECYTYHNVDYRINDAGDCHKASTLSFASQCTDNDGCVSDPAKPCPGGNENCYCDISSMWGNTCRCFAIMDPRTHQCDGEKKHLPNGVTNRNLLQEQAHANVHRANTVAHKKIANKKH